MPQPSILALQAARIRPRIVARARTGDDPTSVALEVVRNTTDLEKIAAEVAKMEAQVADARRRKDPQLGAKEDMLREAKDRLVALRLLVGLPDVPRTRTVRNPANSSERSTLSQAARARALMAGYQGLTGWRAVAAKILPFLFKQEKTPAFDKLEAGAKPRFLAIAKEADAAGQLALHDLLVAGRLTPALLGQLHQLATMTVDSDVDRRLLVSQALVELKDPLTITQGTRGTCAATSIQMLVAVTRPTLYVELLRGLASPGGRARLPGGAEIAREPEWRHEYDGGRSIPSRLIQPALMELGNGELDYLNDKDADLDPATGQTQVSGLEAAQADDVLAQLEADRPAYEMISPTYRMDLDEATARALDNNIAGPRDWLMVVQNPAVIDAASQDRLLEVLAQHATPAKPMYATIVYAPESALARTVFHAVLVTEVKAGQVHFINPWGQEEALPADQFKRCVVNLLAAPAAR